MEARCKFNQPGCIVSVIKECQRLLLLLQLLKVPYDFAQTNQNVEDAQGKERRCIQFQHKLDFLVFFKEKNALLFNT